MDAKTTKWGIIAAVALGFVLFAPELFGQIPYVGPWLTALAKFAAVGGLAKLGIEARDSKTN